MARAAFLMKEQGRQAWEARGLGQYLQERYVWSLLLLFVCLFNSEESHFADKVQREGHINKSKEIKGQTMLCGSNFQGFFFFFHIKK